MRGEHIPCAMAFCSRLGSSPHARGALVVWYLELALDGIIPACAGSTLHRVDANLSHQDHPRMRGEHTTKDTMSNCELGSSPHARGALPPRLHGHRRDGIIPACAGSTVIMQSRTQSTGDHPRMRGEHFTPGRSGRSISGSSPHARGAPTSPSPSATAPGIIPACAGSTRCPRRVLRFGWDHPRMRGEH